MNRFAISAIICVALLMVAGVLMMPSARADGHEKKQTNDDGFSAKDIANIERAVYQTNRPEADTKRDQDRMPVATLSFFQIKRGMHVADMMAGGGYYTEIFSHVVGNEGKVYAHNNSIALKRFANAAMTKRLTDSDLPNVTRLDAELETPQFPKGELDAVFMGQFYHDSYWMKADRAAMNEAVFESLKPGGVFCITDHHAEPGSKDRDVQSLHRVDAELVKKEILAAGFVLEAESDHLRNPDDDHTINVFRPEIRGKTDRFVYRFRKPQ